MSFCPCSELLEGRALEIIVVYVLQVTSAQKQIYVYFRSF